MNAFFVILKRCVLTALVLPVLWNCSGAAEELSQDADSDNDAAQNSDNDTATTGAGIQGLVDVHVHASINETSALAADLLNAMSESDFSLNVLMSAPVPLVSDIGSAEDSAALVSYFSSSPESFRFLYGGAELQPYLHAVGRTTAFTEENVFPNGTERTDLDASLAEMTAIAADPDTWEDDFQALATAAAASGNYAGFGEFGPLHFSQRADHPEMAYPADHAWMLWLSDLAAENGMVLDVHLEATEDSLAELENLLAHNHSTKIIWDHAGWSNTGLATAETLEAMLAAHSNLYLSVKLRDPDSEEMSAAYPFEDDGTLKEAWLTLFEARSDRIMIGSDVKHWQEQGGTVLMPSVLLPSVAEELDTLLAPLSSEAQENIKNGTAIEVFGI